MKTEKYYFIVMLLSLLILTSCEKDCNQIGAEDSLLTIHLDNRYPNSKAAGEGHLSQSDDNYINKLEIFIFNAGNDKFGTLDSYAKFDNNELDEIKVKATTGEKFIYVIANSPNTDWAGVNNHDKFKKEIVSITTDNLKNFIMTSYVACTLQPTTSLTLALTRMAAKIELQGIKTSFAGGPYAGCKLENVKAYLINVHSAKHYFDGKIDNPVVFNYKMAKPEDINSCTMNGMLYDVINKSIDDSGYTTPHFFYAYENMIQFEQNDNFYTRLIIQADLNGTTYYYPININQENSGYVQENGHYGVKRNTSYKYNVTIFRPGSTDPNIPLEHGIANFTLNVINWYTTNNFSPEF